MLFRWFWDDGGAGDGGGNGGESDIASLPEAWQKTIKDLRAEAAATRKRLRDMEGTAEAQAAAAREAEEKRLAEEKRWQELAEQRERELNELKPKVETGSRVIEAFTGSLKKRLEGLPDYLRTLAEKISDPVELAAWLDENHDKIARPQAPNLDQGSPQGGGGQGNTPVLTPEQIEQAKLMRMTPHAYAKQLAEIQKRREAEG